MDMDKIYAITPYVGLGLIQFGLTRENIIGVMKEEPTRFYKTPESLFQTDAFRDIGMHIYYRDNYVCCAIEVFKYGQVVISYKEQQLLGQPYGLIEEWIKKIDENLVKTDTGFLSLLLGISIYAPAALEEPEEPIDAILVFEKGYNCLAKED